MMLSEILREARIAQQELALTTTETKNRALELIAEALIKNESYIIQENAKDIVNAKASGLNDGLIDRLTINHQRINDMVKGVGEIIALPDYNNEILEENIRPNGLRITKVRVPLGVVAIIYESRPNVSVDISVLCLKTSNSCVLKGGKEAVLTNIALVKIMQDAIKDLLNPNIFTLITSTSRETTNELITMKNYIDVLIPRGSKKLIDYVVNNAKIPYIETGAGNCFLYVENQANQEMALKVALNAKQQRPSVCNAIENLLVDEEIASVFLPKLKALFDEYDIEIRGCEKTCKIIDCKKATEEDFYTEYNALIISIKVIKDYKEAISFINSHSTHHSESIITENNIIAEKFLNQIDSACVYHNASTRFTDGGVFGLGAEIGISTQKLHARGPMGLKELFSYKYKILGKGEIR